MLNIHGMTFKLYLLKNKFSPVGFGIIFICKIVEKFGIQNSFSYMFQFAFLLYQCIGLKPQITSLESIAFKSHCLNELFQCFSITQSLCIRDLRVGSDIQHAV